MRILESPYRSVWHNLALEDALLDRFETTGPVLLFSVNDRSVVIGKNQVIWRECSTAALRRDGIPVGRRVSGGGTVFHDPGNMNFSLMVPRRGYDQNEVYRAVITALQPWGIHADVAQGNSLVTEGRKFSGNAFCFRRDAVLHHGTLLVHADLNDLGRYLKPALSTVSTRAIASRPFPVVNLTECAPGLSPDDLKQSLLDVMIRTFGSGSGTAMTVDDTLHHEVESRVADTHGQESWIYRHSPRFTWTLNLGNGEDVETEVYRGAIETIRRRPDRDPTGIRTLNSQPFLHDALLNYAIESRDQAWEEALIAHPF